VDTTHRWVVSVLLVIMLLALSGCHRWWHWRHDHGQSFTPRHAALSIARQTTAAH
jgi:hypothetical protein